MNDSLSDAPADQGNQNTGSELGWRSALPDNLKNHEFIKDYSKPGDAIQDFVNLKTEAASMLKVPGENATDAEKAAFYNKMGRPETADKYTIGKPENYPDGLQYTEDVEKVFRNAFHEAGIPDKAAKTLWGKYHELAVQGFESQQRVEKEALDKAVNTLKDEWKGDAFKVNTETAHRAFMKTFDDTAKQAEAKAFIENTKINGLALGDHPMFLRIFSQIGKAIGNDSMGISRDSNFQGGMSEEEIARKRFPNTKFE